MRWWDGITNSVNMNLSKPWETVRDREALACCSPWGGNNLEIEQQQPQQFMAGRNVNGKATVGSNWQLSEMLRVESPLVSTCSRLNV